MLLGVEIGFLSSATRWSGVETVTKKGGLALRGEEGEGRGNGGCWFLFFFSPFIILFPFLFSFLGKLTYTCRLATN